MIDIKDKDILDIIFELTHIKDEEGNDIPNFCFASDISVDLDAKEEEIAEIALNGGYKVYKVFPGETMLGGLLIVAEGATIEPVENMYKEFYGEVPEISEMQLDDEGHLVELESVEEDLDLDVLPELTDTDRFGDYESYMHNKEQEARDLGFELEFHTKVGPKRLDSLWYEGEDIATLRYNDYVIAIFGLSEDGYVILTDGTEIPFDELEDYGIYNDETFPEYDDCLFSGIEFAIKKIGSHESYSSYGDLGFDTMWDIESALDIKSYLEDVIPAFQEMIGEENIDESKHKKPKMKKVGDPNAKAMWGRTRHRVELPKKGKGSFKRHAKHRMSEEFALPSEQDEKELLKCLEDLGFVIESVKEYDDEAEVHIQVYDGTEFPHEEGDSAEAIFRRNESAIRSRENDLADAIDKFDEEHNNEFHMTYAIGFGGTSVTGIDCTARISAGIDMRGIWVEDEPEDIQLGEDLDIQVDAAPLEAQYMNTAKQYGASLDIYDDIREDRMDSVWYDGVVGSLEYDGVVIDIVAVGDVEATLSSGEDADEYINMFNSSDFEDNNIYSDADLRQLEEEGKLYWDMNNWFEFSIYLKDDDRNTILHSDEMGYGVLGDLEEAFDIAWYIDEVIPEFKREYLDESKKKKSNPLKAAANKHKKTDKKGAMGWFIHPNVEQSIQHFNHVSDGSAESTITAPAGLGEDIDVTLADKYYWEYDTANKFTRTGYSYEDDAEAPKKRYYIQIPEVCYVVKKENYKTDKLLKRRKNKAILKNVDKFFKDHPSAKTCVISCKDMSFSEEGRYVNAYRVLDEFLYSPKKEKASELVESQEDYWVLSDGKNPRHSSVYSEIKDIDDFITELEKNKGEGYWELLHYVNHDPIKVWSTTEGKVTEDLDDNLNEKVEKHDTLNPKLWDEAGNLKPEVREKILEIVKDFTDGLEEDEIKFKIKDIVLVGSNCSYNYNDKSDLDIHIRMDTDSLECPDNLYPLLYGAYRSLYNNKMDIDFYGIPVEIYIETDDTKQLNDVEPGEGVDKPE